MTGADERFRPHERLRSAGQFRRVLKVGIRVDGPLFGLVAAVGERPFPRLGLTASRRVGGAVARNRAKRLLRETFRRNKPELGAIDLVLVAKPEIVSKSQQEVEGEFRDRLQRLARRWPPRPRGAAAPVRD
ncbi:MAG TPA: ribonuclease P protein component [Vicinamibacteria bacterium]|nr:ribonuclease P protein component [Vicinamibacteria bacterium]